MFNVAAHFNNTQIPLEDEGYVANDNLIALAQTLAQAGCREIVVDCYAALTVKEGDSHNEHNRLLFMKISQLLRSICTIGGLEKVVIPYRVTQEEMQKDIRTWALQLYVSVFLQEQDRWIKKKENRFLEVFWGKWNRGKSEDPRFGKPPQFSWLQTR